MHASFVDLRKKSAEIFRALSRNEKVTVLYRGKPAAVMLPIPDSISSEKSGAESHPAFGMWADRNDIVDATAHVRELRAGRFRDL